MQRKKFAALATAVVVSAALVQPFTAGSAGAAPAAPRAAAAPDRAGSDGPRDNLSMPWQRKYEGLRQAAAEKKLRTGSRASVQKLAKGQYAKTTVSGTDRIFAVIAEYGNERHSEFCDAGEKCKYESDGSPQRFDGPLHNEIPKPNRQKDNSTNWQADYDRSHYEHMYFTRMRKFFENQSLGTYSVDGDVTEWVTVPYNQARYGRDFCGGVACSNTWMLIRDALAVWTEQKLASGMTMEEIQAYLRTFDRQDRYDYDEDGDFEEPDGYIDHFQVVHAGGDQADGDPIYGEDAIWSHRWYAQVNGYGTDGPEGYADFGGVEIGEGGTSDPEGSAVEIPDNPTDVWVGDYTIQPENGGLGVFAHEFAHDLGLPDHYDTGGAENSVGWWSLMSQSRGTLPRDGGIGDRAMPFGAYDKFFLGWLDYRTVMPGRSSRFKMRPSQQKTKRGINGAVALLPDKVVQSSLGDPCATCGEQYYYSDSGDDLNNTMTRSIEGGGELTAKVRYEIEDGWDYAFLESSSDGGDSWDPVDTSESYAGEDESGFNSSGTGISGNTGDLWVDLTATIPDAANALRWRYRTDGAFTLPGFQVDNMAIGGTGIGDAEDGAGAWSLDGFLVTTGSEEEEFLNAYFVENRQYKGLDRPLKHVYNFGGTKSSDDWVEFWKLQPGALINYYDTSQSDNNVGAHPGEGLILPVDAHPSFVHTPDGELARPRINSWNATFTPRRMRGQTLHSDGTPFRLPANRGRAVFRDNRDWWYDSDEHGSHEDGRYQPGWYGVDVPKTGTKIKVRKVGKRGVIALSVN